VNKDDRKPRSTYQADVFITSAQHHLPGWAEDYQYNRLYNNLEIKTYA
jgi:hypothetical protein